MDLKIESILDEQVAVAFTGKVNVLSNFNHQFLGHIIFKNGEIFRVRFNGLTGMKALYHIFLQEYSLQSFQYIIEPEVVEGSEKEVLLPYSQLKKKMKNVLRVHQESLKSRPPENVRILIDAGFLEDKAEVSKEEFEVLAALTEWSSPFDVYQHCSLLDHEITAALVSLRRKKALKIVAAKDNP